LKTIDLTPEQLALLIADEFRSWLSTAGGSDLVDAAVNYNLGLSIERVDSGKPGTADNVSIDIISTSGTIARPCRSDQATDFVGYLPYQHWCVSADPKLTS
jgi:hypothetical protein